MKNKLSTFLMAYACEGLKDVEDKKQGNILKYQRNFKNKKRKRK